MQLRVGSGFDLHRLKTGRRFLLGGVEIPAPVGPYGHSDGDPLLHAVADALLGAAALGDIGDHFPDNDPKWKDCPGDRLLELVMGKVAEAGLRVVNADITVFLEKPALKEKKREIRDRVGELIGIEADCVNVKAKTAEGFGALGRGDCIGVHATVLMEKR